MKKKCKVIELKTDRHGCGKLHRDSKTHQIHYAETISNRMQINGNRCDLYVTSDDKIQADDWIYLSSIGNGTIGKYSYDKEYKTHDLTTIGNVHYPFSTLDSFKKVIATTDTALKLPLLPKSFIKKFVEEEGKIDEILVEYYKYAQAANGTKYKYDIYKLKTREDNTIRILPAKTYTAEEVFDLTLLAMEDSRTAGHIADCKIHIYHKAWIKIKLNY